MAFLNPWLLWLGVASVSVPIIIHLLNKRKFDRVVWAAMRFLRVSVEQNQRRIKIEDLLLLALRCLMLLLLALALARPALRAAQSGGLLGQASVTGVIVLDNSYSMSATDGVKSRFELAKNAAEQVIDSAPSGSALAVILASDVADRVIPEPTFDLNMVRQTIHDARLSDRSTQLADPVRAALDILKGRAGIRKEIYLLTDGQALGWRQIDSIHQMLQDAAQAAQGIKAHLIFVGSPLDANLGVSDLRLSTGLAAIGRPLRYEVQVTNYGLAEQHDVQVSLHVDADPPADQTTIDAIPPGASKTVSLFAKLRDAGYHSVTASIPSDHLPADDTRTIAVRGIAQVKVLLVDAEQGQVRSARETETFYLKNILLPVPAAQQDQYYIKVTTLAPGELETTHLDDYDAVILGDVPDFSAPTLEAFATYLRRGRGGLIIFPGPRTITSFYNDQLLNRYHFLPASLGEPQGKSDQEDAFFTLQDQGFDHPIAAVWSDPAAGTPAAGHFFRAFDLTPDPLMRPTGPGVHAGDSPLNEAGQPRVVLRFAPSQANGPLSGKPAVMERTWGEGRVILFASTASTRWNDMPVRRFFAPLIYRSLAAVVQRQDEALNVRSGVEKFAYHVGDELVGKEAMIYTPAGAPGAAAGQHAADARRVELVDGVPTLSYDQTGIAGEYRAVFTDPPLTIRFASQPDPSESNLDQLTREQKNALGDVAHIVDWTPQLHLDEEIASHRVGTELWLPLAFLAAVLATAETFLAHWFSRVK